MTNAVLESSSFLGGENRDDQWLVQFLESKIQRCILLFPGFPFSMENSNLDFVKLFARISVWLDGME